jgi:hypothetical protein
MQKETATPQEVTDERPRRVLSLPRIAIPGSILTLLLLVSSVSADVTVNWSSIADIMNGVGTYVFPAIGNMVLSIVPTMIIIAVVGFVMMFFDKILDMMRFR